MHERKGEITQAIYAFQKAVNNKQFTWFSHITQNNSLLILDIFFVPSMVIHFFSCLKLLSYFTHEFPDDNRKCEPYELEIKMIINNQEFKKDNRNDSIITNIMNEAKIIFSADTKDRQIFYDFLEKSIQKISTFLFQPPYNYLFFVSNHDFQKISQIILPHDIDTMFYEGYDSYHMNN
ncbi:hypothetical protein TRFO_16637 [Tritrichomonas foetus]|uniref:Uncharacterized protein n=1 Tax=Tritrichomonas foetus TaxID=1144522 RepID=A0A1J4KQU6_9EUKA|nr:hypothetical protein TRFO_16637 [Tritrichomonas foetus]|eukprot:OHT13304.1 hypothetical protein TRFO_16637 [Tritrichomonas foetus]